MIYGYFKLFSGLGMQSKGLFRRQGHGTLRVLLLDWCPHWNSDCQWPLTKGIICGLSISEASWDFVSFYTHCRVGEGPAHGSQNRCKGAMCCMFHAFLGTTQSFYGTSWLFLKLSTSMMKLNEAFCCVLCMWRAGGEQYAQLKMDMDAWLWVGMWNAAFRVICF